MGRRHVPLKVLHEAVELLGLRVGQASRRLPISMQHRPIHSPSKALASVDSGFCNGLGCTAALYHVRALIMA